MPDSPDGWKFPEASEAANSMAEPNDIPSLPSQVLSERYHLTIPSLPSWIEPTVDYLLKRALMCGACQPTRADKLMIALHEALSNSLLHGNLELSSELKEQGDSHFAEALARRAKDPFLASRQVDIVGQFDGEVSHWIITDRGNGFDVDAVLARCLSDDPDLLLASGRGLLLMKSFLDDVRFEMGGRRVILSLKRRSGEEKRSLGRTPINLSFQVTPITPDGTVRWADTYEAVSRNFTEHGIALLQEQLAHTPRVLIGILSEGEIIYVPAEVKHARPFGDGMELGCSFTRSLGPDRTPRQPTADDAGQAADVQQTISQLLESHQPQPTVEDERRVHPRVVYNDSVLIYRDDRPEPMVAYARDLSKGGIAFILQEPLPLESEFTVGFTPKESEPPFKVRCRVVRCGRIKDRFFDIGAVFSELDERE